MGSIGCGNIILSTITRTTTDTGSQAMHRFRLPVLLCGSIFAIALAAQQPPSGNVGGRGGGRGGRGEAETVVPIDPAAVERGNQIFRANCAFCHGIDARGAEGPDLMRSLYLTNDEGGKELGAFLKVGNPGSGMPAFLNLPDDQVKDISAFLHQRLQESRARINMDPKAIVVGAARSGEAYFNGDGKCSTCHSTGGDLKGVGSKYDPMTLQSRIINPRGGGRGGRGGPPPKPSTVSVTLSSGQTISGTLVAVNDFFVTLVTSDGDRRTFNRDNNDPKVSVADPYQGHLDLFLKITNKNMHDLTAYLVTLK